MAYLLRVTSGANRGQGSYAVGMPEHAAGPEIIDTIPRTLRQRVEEARVEFRLRFHRKFRRRVERLGNVIPTDSTVLDIGGNHGRFATELARLHGGSLRVHTFEPLAFNFRVLSRNAHRFGNLTAHNCGLSDSDSEATLFTPVQRSGLVDHGQSFIAETPPVELGPYIPKLARSTVHLRHGGQMLDELGVQTFTFAKLDVQGHEATVLDGLMDRITRDWPMLLVEMTPREHMMLFNTKHPAELLDELGYRAIDTTDAGGKWPALSWKDAGDHAVAGGSDYLAWHPDGPAGEIDAASL